MFLTTLRKGSACEPPSSPQCFKRKTDDTIYRCEWSMNTTESDVKFDLYFDKRKFGSKNTWCEIFEEELIRHRPVHIRVEAHVGNSKCTSTPKSVILANTVKYEAPQHISMSWLKNNLSLSWTAAEKRPALAEVRFRRDEWPTESWENRSITTDVTDGIYVCQVDLLKNSSHQVQIRHKPTLISSPLWSDWSPVVTVPAELKEKPDVTVRTRLVNGTRKVMLTWKLMPQAAAVTGVTYNLNNPQSTLGCPCHKKRKRHTIKTNKYTTYVSCSAVNISVVAKNAAGSSPPTVIQVPAQPPERFEICDKTLVDEKFKRETCLELYELRDGDSRPENVITLTAKNKKKQKQPIKKNARYLYFEHRCSAGKPKTVKMCLFYREEDVPLREPQNLTAFAETHNSANLSWKAIPTADQRGFLTHYSLCRVNMSSQNKTTVCGNISASLVTYHLENLTPGAKYNISLAGATRVGKGPEATVIINTLPEKPANVWWSLGLLFVFSFVSTLCSVILKRVKIKIFPPVPKPVIQDFTSYPAESQELLEEKEEVHELTLHQIHPEGKSVPEDSEETILRGGEWDDGTDEDTENERSDSRMSGGINDECLCPGSTDLELRSSREGEMTDLEQVENEIAKLIYRNGLVFDVKTDSP